LRGERVPDPKKGLFGGPKTGPPRGFYINPSRRGPAVPGGGSPPPGVPRGGVAPRRGVQGRIPCPDKGRRDRAARGLAPADELVKVINSMTRRANN